ncbi:hypothetical protein HYV12_03615 [Candidatus Dojkabacteria bacterium]|nr:hypothetical protein [Candidatus Dojkabacteria bacterium]
MALPGGNPTATINVAPEIRTETSPFMDTDLFFNILNELEEGNCSVIPATLVSMHENSMKTVVGEEHAHTSERLDPHRSPVGYMLLEIFREFKSECIAYWGTSPWIVTDSKDFEVLSSSILSESEFMAACIYLRAKHSQNTVTQENGIRASKIMNAVERLRELGYLQSPVVEKGSVN